MQKKSDSSEDQINTQENVIPLRRTFLKPLIAVAVGLVIVASLSAGVYFYLQYKQTREMIANPSAAAQKEIQALVKKISKVMILPANEQPTIATVTDKTKLNSQPFFAHAENQDKVIIYSTAKKVILYRPSSNLIVEVAPLNVEKNTAQKPATDQGKVAGATTVSVTPTPTEKLAIKVLNGTTLNGMASKTQKELTQKYPTFSITVGDTTKKDYTKTVVYNLTGKDDQAREIASYLKADVETSLPQSEVAQGNDIVIIVAETAPTVTPTE